MTNVGEQLTFKLLCDGNVWQWQSIPGTPAGADAEATPEQSYVPPKGFFQRQHILVDASDGKIVDVFPLTTDISGILEKYPAEKVDMAPMYIIPGLQESHVHLAGTAMGRSSVNLRNSTSVEEISHRLQKFAASHPHMRCIIGDGWEQQKFIGVKPEMPTRYDLDHFFPTQAVFIFRICYHFLVCNTAAMKLCGLNPENSKTWPTSLPLHQCRFTADGVSLGIFWEEAITYLNTFITLDEERLYGLVGEEMKFFAANGITAVQSNDLHIDALYVRLLSEGLMTLRMYHTIMFEELRSWLEKAYHEEKKTSLETSISLEELEIFSQTLPRESLCYHSSYGSYLKKPDKRSLLSCDRVKLFADGSLGGQTAALRKAYLEPPGAERESNSQQDSVEEKSSKFRSNTCRCRNFGTLRESAGDFKQKLAIIKNCDLRVEVHAIGDAAAELVIQGLIATGMVGLYHLPVLTHCQFLGEDLIPLMSKHKIIGNIQPSFLPSDNYLLENSIDKDLLPYSYAWKTMLQHGIECAGGSDSPIEYPSPLKGMFDSMYRPMTHFHPHSLMLALARMGYMKDDQQILQVSLKNTDVAPLLQPPKAYRESECLSFDESLALYTIGSSFAAKSDERTSGSEQKPLTGRILPGYLADFTVLDRDISRESYRSLMEAIILQTWVNGKIVYSHTVPTV
ncbi:putative amidohydrolase YtcJ [Cardiosporidium cionae]|uniref:Amidohydrolase YtcJ n=1 Tax=Cardiosporidium cionae TaxID=476202 RepID=A0ABQ7J8D4_9APIC|nr:putative amidohydrolase YtcJ [Cardiosporidium cionae]|eukprot:KAF8820247.1 putative amidohydrolase YtcJ [Cardiosporidium cionae]